MTVRLDLALPVVPVPDDQLDARTVADILDRAAQLIEANGLEQGEFWTCSLFATSWTEGRGCDAVGAIGVAAGYRDHTDVSGVIAGLLHYDVTLGRNVAEPPHPALAALMRDLGVDQAVAVMDWSDRSTDTEVVRALRTCAAGLRIGAQAGTS